MADYLKEIKKAKKYSIVDYLESKGIEFKPSGKKMVCSSPFSNDSNWSFVVYPNNYFCDFSTGRRGDLLDLVCEMEDITVAEAVMGITSGALLKGVECVPNLDFKVKKKTFSLSDHIADDKNDMHLIRRYAESRHIYDGYCYVQMPIMSPTGWIRVPAMGFVHVDTKLKTCGVKMRRASHTCDPKRRFWFTGNEGLYVLENFTGTSEEATMYFVESETSAVSLWQHLRNLKRHSVVISFGGISNVIKEIPQKYSLIYDRKIIIDFDGNEELYNRRLDLHSGLRARPITLRLEKGEDLNTMFCDKSINQINELL